MYIPYRKPYWNWNYARFVAAPLILKIFTVFSVVITVFGIAVAFILPKSIDETLVQVTGWAGLLMYNGPLIFVFLILFARDFEGINRTRMLYTIFAVLGIQIAFAFIPLFDMLQLDYRNYGNPYLTISRWQPLWTILLPLFWVTVLNTKKVKTFCRMPYA